jgi:beta-lactamase class C
MNKKIIPAALLFLFLLLITTPTWQISSSPDVFQKTAEQPLTRTEKELDRMKGLFFEYDEWLNRELNASGTVGAAVAIVYKDQLAFLKCYGTKRSGIDDPVDEHTIFRLASVSKTITGILSGLLAREQELDLDEGVADILPGFRLSSPGNTKQLTIRNLLSHTTGLVPHAYDDLIEGHVPFCTIYKRLQHAAVTASPGQLYSYQNVMFGLMDTILSIKTSKNYRELVEEKIFNPLGMSDASTDFESFRNNPDKAYPHRGGNGSYRTIALNDRYYNVAPAAGINASISDMAQFLHALVDDSNSVIDHDIRETVFKPQIATPLSRGYFRYWDGISKKQYALGWRIIDYKGREIAYHGGFVSGYKSEIAICREENIGIVYLTNSPDHVASQSIPVFLNSYFDSAENETVKAQAEENDKPGQNSTNS